MTLDMKKIDAWVCSLSKPQQRRLNNAILIGGKVFKDTLFQLLEETDTTKDKKRIA